MLGRAKLTAVSVLIYDSFGRMMIVAQPLSSLIKAVDQLGAMGPIIQAKMYADLFDGGLDKRVCVHM